ncbi:MAG: hypothetical protein DRP97_03570 [Candidatus Latescibacterota bacterium]|nr:MAG: hypothetical protein DRP97_03570 [Candidatus Latescibacterota bacterium]
MENTQQPQSQSDIFTPSRGVSTPLLISLVIFVLSSALAWFLTDALDWDVKVALFFGLLVTVVFWIIYIVIWLRSVGTQNIVYAVEEFTGKEINNDGTIGKPQKQTIRLEVPSTENGSWAMQYYDMPEWVDAENLAELANRMVAGKNFSEPELVRGANRIYLYDEFIELRDYFINRGILKLKNPNGKKKDVVRTKSGEDLFLRIKNYAAH